MNVKKIILIISCLLVILSSTFTISAAKSVKLTKLKTPQVFIEVIKFNETKLAELNWYISHINPDHYMAKDLINLYQKLDDLVVSDISVANELNEPTNSDDPNSIGSQLENLFSFLDVIGQRFGRDPFEKSNPSYFNRHFAQNLDTKIKNLLQRIEQISN